MQSAARVGLLVVVFVGMLVGAYAFLQRSMFQPKRSTYYAEFADAGGVAVGARVLLAGVNIGTVSKVELADGVKARLTLDVDQAVRIPAGSQAVLPTALIGIGDRQIEITPVKGTSGYLESGATLPGVMKSPLEAFAPDSQSTVKALESTLNAATATMNSMNKLISDQALKGDVQKLMQQSADTAAAFGRLASRLDQTLAQNQASLTAMLRSGKQVGDDLAHVSHMFAEYVKTGKVQGSMEQMMATMNATLEQGQLLVKDMRAITSDVATQENIKLIVANTQLMTKSGTEIAKNAETLTAKGIGFADEATELMKKANHLADEAGELFKDIKKRIVGGDGASSVLGGAASKISAEVDAHHEAGPDRWRTDASISFPLNSKDKLHIGMWDAFESNKLNLQVSTPVLKKGELRYGVYASKPGVGVRLPLNSRFSLQANAFGINKSRLDGRLEFKVNKNAAAWIGFDRIFDRNTPGFGVGIRR